jgi:methylthioribose-1-phosphate isomerase
MKGSDMSVALPATIKWSKGCVKIIDQTQLPHKLEYITCRDVETLWAAIKRLSVRGAPALGIAAAFGVVLGAKAFKGQDSTELIKHVFQCAHYLGTSRPTAVNLFNALDQMKIVAVSHQRQKVPHIIKALEKAAMDIYRQDQRVCREMGKQGAKLIRSGQSAMTVCNAGGLATADFGTALGVFYAAKDQGKDFQVYACETRPLLQGARLTTWELLRAKINTTLICDNMAATVMAQGRVDMIFAGADRIAANGDTANKIGTYSLAVLAKYHRIPFYIVAPQTTFDMTLSDGRQIPIEERDKDEVRGFGTTRTAPKNVGVYNPAFDVTPHKLITAIVTEKGLIQPVNKKNIKIVLAG